MIYKFNTFGVMPLNLIFLIFAYNVNSWESVNIAIVSLGFHILIAVILETALIIKRNINK